MTKNVMSTALVVFMVMAIMSVAIVLPVLSQTVSVELVKAWPKWRKLKLSEHPYQILYAKAKNTGTEGVYAKVTFFVRLMGGPGIELDTDIVFLPPTPQPIRLEVEYTPDLCGSYTVHAYLWYLAAGDWLIDGVKRFEFRVVP